jgi:hypothetical protein
MVLLGRRGQMNKYLVMVAGALAVSSTLATGAAAKKHGTVIVALYTTDGAGLYCDYIHIGWNGVHTAQSDDLNVYCGVSFVSKGAGTIGDAKGYGPMMTNSDDQFDYFYGPGVYGLSFEYIPSPTLDSSGRAEVWYSTTCCSSSLLNVPYYVVVGPGAKHQHGKVSLLQSLIATGRLKPPGRKPAAPMITP